MAISGNTVVQPGPAESQLASVPAVARTHLASDGVQPSTDTPSNVLAPSAKTLGDATPELKFKTVEQLVRSQDRMTRNDYAIDTHFRRVRDGVAFSTLEKVPNQHIWIAKLPNGITKESSSAVPNKADDLCNKVEDTLMADPAKPDPMAHVNDDATKPAAELAGKFLQMDAGEVGTNDVETYRWALNNAFTGASSYLHYVVDHTGGGYQPLQKLAHPMATDPSNPLVAIIPGPPDPITGQPTPGTEDRATNPILRYVSPPTPEAPEGQFVEEAMQADRVWLPKIRIERTRREQVRVFPATATVENAVAVIVIRFPTLAEARTMWPDTVGAMSGEQLASLAQWKPPLGDLIVPFAFRGSLDSVTGPTVDEVGSLSPILQRRMFAYRLYVAKSPEYPKGYQLDISGADGGTILGETDLEYTVTLPTQGQVTRCKDIMVVQVRPMQDVQGGNPKGWPFISRFAGASEASATMYSAFMDACDNMLHPHVYLRTTSTIDEDEWFDRSRPMLLHPQDPEPTYEHFSPLPPILPLLENLDTKQDTASGLTGTAQGLDSANAVSGVAKSLTIRQAQVSLSGFQQNLHAAMTRGWRLKCQLAQAEFTTPQLLSYTGQDNSDEPQWWTGEDMAGVDRIGIQPGTGSMMTPEGKAQYVAFLQSQQWMDPQRAAQVALPGIRADLGLPEDPFEAAIERGVSDFLQGPPEGWVEQQAQQQQAMQQAQAEYQQQTAPAAQLGQPVAPFVPPQMAPLHNPFPPRANDGEPMVAMVYLQRLSKLLVDPAFDKQPPPWQQTAIAAYQRAAIALQPPPVLPKGVNITEKADPSTVAAAEQGAISGMQKPGQAPQQPQIQQHAPAPKPVPLPKP
jgi:hypothetical protein